MGNWFVAPEHEESDRAEAIKWTRGFLSWPLYAIAFVFWVPATFLTWLARLMEGDQTPTRRQRVALHTVWITLTLLATANLINDARLMVIYQNSLHPKVRKPYYMPDYNADGVMLPPR